MLRLVQMFDRGVDSANMEAELCIESYVRGHHVYKRTWTPSVGEEFSYKRESGNKKDLYTIVASSPGLPVFFSLVCDYNSASMYYTERKPKNKNRGGLETRLNAVAVI